MRRGHVFFYFNYYSKLCQLAELLKRKKSCGQLRNICTLPIYTYIYIQEGGKNSWSGCVQLSGAPPSRRADAAAETS
jgi:hypothetical protein